MASAKGIYVDPSALRCLYIHEERSRAFCSWRKRQPGGLLITLFGRAELVNSISLAIFRGYVTREVGSAALSDLDEDIQEGRLVLTDLLWRLAMDRAADMSATYTPTLGTRALDVLHVASAQVLDCRRFVSYDDRQVALAKAAGLRLVRP